MAGRFALRQCGAPHENEVLVGLRFRREPSPLFEAIM